MNGNVNPNCHENLKFSYLSYNIKLLKTVGLWPLSTDSTSEKHLFNLYKTILAISLLIVSVLQVIQICISPNVTSMASAIDLATLTSAALFRMCYFNVYIEDFDVLVRKVNSLLVDENRFSISQNIKSAWLENSKMLSIVYISSVWIVFCIFFVILPYLSFYFPALHSPGNQALSVSRNEDNRSDRPQFESAYFKTPSGVRPIAKNLSDKKQLNYDNNVYKQSYSPLKENYETRRFPLNCWFPCDVSRSPIYEVVFCLEIFALIGSGHLYLVCDTFFFTIIYLMCGYLEVLKSTFKSIDKHSIVAKTSSTSQRGHCVPWEGKPLSLVSLTLS